MTKKTKAIAGNSGNQPVEGTNNKGGRPLIWDSPVELQEAIDDYFKTCDETIIELQKISKGEIIIIETPMPYTMMGLAAHLGISRNTLNNLRKSDTYHLWKQRNPELARKLSDIVTHARRKIGAALMGKALAGAYDSKIASLNLSSNYGYTQKVEQDVKQTADIRVQIINYKGASGQITPVDGEAQDVVDAEVNQVPALPQDGPEAA